MDFRYKVGLIRLSHTKSTPNAPSASLQPSGGLQEGPAATQDELECVAVLGLDQNDGGADVDRIGTTARSSIGNRRGPGELS